MRPIPPRMRTTLAGLERMKQCMLHSQQDRYGLCKGAPQWHHVWTYGGRQINELWAILCGCEHHHRMVGSERVVKEAFERLSLLLATAEDLAKYPRKDWEQIKKSLGLSN